MDLSLDQYVDMKNYSWWRDNVQGKHIIRFFAVTVEIVSAVGASSP